MHQPLFLFGNYYGMVKPIHPQQSIKIWLVSAVIVVDGFGFNRCGCLDWNLGLALRMARGAQKIVSEVGL